jgi:hypothetical protein
MSEPGKLSLRTGCTGCRRLWGEGEGQCSRCRRCLACCGADDVPYTCAWRWARKDAGQRARSEAAYERWQANPAVLGRNRRIV